MSLGNPQFVESIIHFSESDKEYRIGPARCRISAATEHAPVYSPALAKKILGQWQSGHTGCSRLQPEFHMRSDFLGKGET